jgi:hypothetical protein
MLRGRSKQIILQNIRSDDPRRLLTLTAGDVIEEETMQAAACTGQPAAPDPGILGLYAHVVPSANSPRTLMAEMSGAEVDLGSRRVGEDTLSLD